MVQNLYSKAGYLVIDNYDQYAGLEDSVCMKNNLVNSVLWMMNSVGFHSTFYW